MRMSDRSSDVCSSDLLTNDAANKNAHSIDLHAAQVDVLSEFSDVKPGETKTFSFVAKYPGAFYYHCGADPMYQHIARGMFGVILVDPKDPNALPKADREYVLVQSEIYQNPDDLHSIMKSDWKHVVRSEEHTSELQSLMRIS